MARASRRDPGDGEDTATSDDGVDPDDEGAGTAARTKPGRLERARTSVQSANIDPGKSDISIKWSIDRLDEREKRFSFAASGGALLFGVVVYLAETENSHFRLHKGQLTPQTTLIIGLVAGALLFAATLLGRRAPV